MPYGICKSSFRELGTYSNLIILIHKQILKVILIDRNIKVLFYLKELFSA